MKTLFFFFLTVQSFAQITVLELGQSKTYPGGTKQIWIEKSMILKADSAGGSIKITAKKIGSSRIRINSKNETIEVLHPDQIALFDKMKKLMSTKPGLRVEIENGEIVVKGYIHDWNVWKSISSEIIFHPIP